MARLNAKLDKSGGDSACWEWQGSTTCGFGREVNTLRGYGQVGGAVDGVRYHLLTHRLAFALATGHFLARGECVLHRCDNPPCCNPAHLFLGDRAVNCADKVSKGRQRNGIVPGERHGMHKMTEVMVREMRRAYAAGEASQPELARRFGIRQSSVWSILHRRTWHHIT